VSALLQARALRYGYRPEQPVLRGVDLALQGGRFCCVLGPNGSGKTTLLRCLLGQLRPHSGQVLLRERPVQSWGPRERARLLAYVPQLPASAFPFTVRELVQMGRYAHQGALGLASAEDRQLVQAALERTNTGRFAQRTLAELSGGEAQCAMIARALAQQPAAMLLDEPTSHLDLRNQLLIYGLVRDLTREQGMAALCISHDINLAARYADQLVLLRRGQVVAAGPPSQVLTVEILRSTYGVQVELVGSDSQVPLVRAVAPLPEDPA